METQNQDDYQSGKYLADGWFEWSEPRDLRLRIYDYELRINGDEMFIYKSKNWFQGKDRKWDMMPFFDDTFQWEIGDKGWFVFDKDVPYVEQQELWVEDDEFWNIIIRDDGSPSIRSLDWVIFSELDYNKALDAIWNFLKKF
jgi:hypothetical protein